MITVEVVEPHRLAELRRSVLRPNLPVGTAFDPLDHPGSIHLGALDDGQVIGTVVVFPQGCSERPDARRPWQLRAMAVAAEYQGRGVGSAVLGAAVDRVVAAGADLLWCNARTTALAFYRRHGFVAVGAEFVSAATGIPHFVMLRELPDRPTSST